MRDIIVVGKKRRKLFLFLLFICLWITSCVSYDKRIENIRQNILLNNEVRAVTVLDDNGWGEIEYRIDFYDNRLLIVDYVSFNLSGYLGIVAIGEYNVCTYSLVYQATDDGNKKNRIDGLSVAGHVKSSIIANNLKIKIIKLDDIIKHYNEILEYVSTLAEDRKYASPYSVSYTTDWTMIPKSGFFEDKKGQYKIFRSPISE